MEVAEGPIEDPAEAGAVDVVTEPAVDTAVEGGGSAGRIVLRVLVVIALLALVAAVVVFLLL